MLTIFNNELNKNFNTTKMLLSVLKKIKNELIYSEFFFTKKILLKTAAK